MIDLHYWPTPNGKKVTILLEECGLPYRVVPCSIGQGDQFKDEFLKLAERNAKLKGNVDLVLRRLDADRDGLLTLQEFSQLGKMQGSVNVLDIAEDAAGSDRGELLIITNQPDTRAAAESELDCGVEGQGVGHAGLVDDDQCRRADPQCPIRQLTVVEGPSEFGQRVGGDAGLLA